VWKFIHSPPEFQKAFSNRSARRDQEEVADQGNILNCRNVALLARRDGRVPD